MVSLQDRFRAGQRLSRSEQVEVRLDLIELRLTEFEVAVWKKLELKDQLDEMHANAIQKQHTELAVLREMIEEIIYWSAQREVTSRDLIRQYTQSLNILEQQRAKFGSLHVPVHIETQIIEIKDRLAELHQELLNEKK